MAAFASGFFVTEALLAVKRGPFFLIRENQESPCGSVVLLTTPWRTSYGLSAGINSWSESATSNYAPSSRGTAAANRQAKTPVAGQPLPQSVRAGVAEKCADPDSSG